MTRKEKQKMVIPEETARELIREAVKAVGNEKFAPSAKMPQPKKKKGKNKERERQGFAVERPLHEAALQGFYPT